MYLKIQASTLASGNTGSCLQLVNYLRKEDDLAMDMGKKASFFFSETRDLVFPDEVVNAIDKNGKGGLRNDEAKFFSLVIAPSERELKHIGNDIEKLREYTRDVMQIYAENFNKGLKSSDLVWFAKIEQKRYYKGFDVIPEGMKQGDEKKGLQTHIHVIVSRKTIQGSKISPLANQRGTEITTGTGKKVKAGFDRDKFKIACERLFDTKFNYNPSANERYKGILNEQKYDLSLFQEQSKKHIQQKYQQRGIDNENKF